MPRFSATIYKLGINPVVDPPERVLAAIFKDAGRSKGPIPVRGRVNAAVFQQTLVKYSGAWRLYINGEMLKASGAKVGETVKIDVEFDPSPREVRMPEALAQAFSKARAARSAFDKLAPSRQKEILRYIGSLKTEESIRKNVEKIVRQLRQ